MHNLIKLEHKPCLFMNDQSAQEYQEYLLEQLEFNLDKWKLRYSMNENMLSISGSTNMLEAIIQFIQDDFKGY